MASTAKPGTSVGNVVNLGTHGRPKTTIHNGLPIWGEVIDGGSLLTATRAGLARLNAFRDSVNALNVFPIPDGDTGTNMVLTMRVACEEAGRLPKANAGEIAAALAHGALMGARGNSGVILSQLWRGFAAALRDCSVIRAEDLARALAEARRVAYQAVARPVEGTILTVSTDIAAAARSSVDQGTHSVVDLLMKVVEEAQRSVQRTPDLLPLLKQAGVTDSGGAGLYFILDGMLRSAFGEDPEDTGSVASGLPDTRTWVPQATEPGQEWEVVVDLVPSGELGTDAIQRCLEPIGVSLQIGQGDGLYRVHVHVAEGHEFTAVQALQPLGLIQRVSMENLKAQVAAHQPAGAPPAPPTYAETQQIAAVAVASGPGLVRLLQSLGAAAVVQGGPLMNPSVDELLQAMEHLPCERVVLLPNDPNILQAAEQAAKMSTHRVHVVPTRSVPQGVAALLAFDADGEIESVVAVMKRAGQNVRTAEFACATRDAQFDGVDVAEGQSISMLDGKLVAAADTLADAVQQTLLAAGTAQLATLYVGTAIGRVEVEKLSVDIRKAWPRLEVEVIEGGQPHRPLIMSLE